MKKFKVYKLEVKTLRVLNTYVIEVVSAESARQLGIVRYETAGTFIGASNL